MGKKKAENRYGVQAGDIFVRRTYGYEGTGGCDSVEFYQVVRLRGETQVVLKQINSAYTAFDQYDAVLVPISDSWAESAEELIRKVNQHESTDPQTQQIEKTPWVDIARIGWGSYGYLYDKNRKYTCMDGWLYFCHDKLCRQFPQLEQFELKSGSGIYAADGAFQSVYDDCPVIVRYPDGKQERRNLKDMFYRNA